MSEQFDLDSFIAGINQDRVQPRNSKDRLNRILMNARPNQGTVTFIPCYSKGAKNFYMKVPGVYEFYGDTSLIDNGEGWYKILPLDMYGELSEENVELYNEVKGYLDYLHENEEVSYDEFRIRHYSLFYGICLKLKNTEDKENPDIVECPCLFVYPNSSPISKLCDAINTRIDNANGKKDWINKVLTLNNSGRRGVVQITFTSKEGDQPGYDTTAGFAMNNSDEGLIMIDPEYEISDETFKKFDDVIPCFLGWIYDYDNKKYFNETAFKELRDQLKLRVKSVKAAEGGDDDKKGEAPAENKNNLEPEAPRTRRTF